MTGTQDGDEGLALAEYLQCKLQQQDVCPVSFLDGVRLSPEGKTFADPSDVDFSHKNLELALQIDRFSFAMEVEKTTEVSLPIKWCCLKVCSQSPIHTL